jgi:roadblock/LC7 domain-containing protein
MLKRLLALDGVMAVAKFRDDGEFVEGYGMLDASSMRSLSKFALSYKRITQGNADQLSMFTQKRGWTPPKGWAVRGQKMSVCNIGNIVCFMANDEGSLSEVMRELEDLASY